MIHGWEVLTKHGVDVNILCTLHAANADHPLEIYRFFRDDLGARFLQFIPIVERRTPATFLLANAGWSKRLWPRAAAIHAVRKSRDRALDSSSAVR